MQLFGQMLLAVWVVQAPTNVCSCTDASTKAVQTFGTSACRLTAWQPFWMCFYIGPECAKVEKHAAVVEAYPSLAQVCDNSSGNAMHLRLKSTIYSNLHSFSRI